MLMLSKRLAVLLLTAALCLACYALGRSHAEVRIVKEKGDEIIKETEVIKYVTRQKAKIWSQPNAERDDLLERMRTGRL